MLNADAAGDWVDVAFALQGTDLPREHAHLLRDALCAAWPALADTPGAGIHGVKLVAGGGPRGMLSRRAQLVVRAPGELANALLATADLSLRVGETPVRLSGPRARALLPHATLYAYHVATPSADELTLAQAVEQELAALGVEAERVFGHHHHRVTVDGDLHTFSLMLHGLKPAHAQRVLQHGIGPHRLLGCGLFVPHKSAAAV